jgi:hypothetical protein
MVEHDAEEIYDKTILMCKRAIERAETVLAAEFGIARGFDVVDILDLASGIDAHRAYLYGGSFYTRYLGRAGRLAELSPNAHEAPVSCAPEFSPLFEAGTRLNGLNVWTPPIAAEFLNRSTDAETLSRIRENALAELCRSSFSQLVVCEPFAWRALSEIPAVARKLVYFWDILG